MVTWGVLSAGNDKYSKILREKNTEKVLKKSEKMLKKY